MNDMVYEGSHAVGEIVIEPCGLYYEIKANVSNRGIIQRLYGIYDRDFCYIGIPDQRGELFRRVPKRNFRIPQRVILSDLPPDQFCLTDTSTESERDCINRESVADDIPDSENQGSLWQLSLIEKKIEREHGGEENEVHPHKLSSDLDPLLLADLPADYDYGGSGTEEADCDHI